MDKILICGPRGVGKSTLIRRLAALYPGPVSGFVTKRLTTADGEGMFPIYIHPAAQPEDRRQYGPENLAGRCDSRRSARYTPVFDAGPAAGAGGGKKPGRPLSAGSPVRPRRPGAVYHPGQPGGAIPRSGQGAGQGASG